MSSQIKLPNHDAIRDYVSQALSEVDMLNSGQYQWRTSIPVQMSDSDVRISNALYCVSPLLDELAALKAENERLRAALEDNAPSQSYGYTVSIILPDGNPTTMPSKGTDDHDALAYAMLILERDYKDYPVKIVGISRVIAS